ncbi:MAG: RsmD family RNA methyltransferase, partial [Woeseiales bacterium]
IERDVQLARNLQQQADLLGAHMVQIVCADATDWLSRATQCFDVVFIDPPYGTVELLPLMTTLHREARVNAASKVYAEVPVDDNRPIFPHNWSL